MSSASNGYALIDWITDYIEGIERPPGLESEHPAGRHPRDACRPIRRPSPEAFTDVLDDIDDIIVPGLTHWQHPNFFAWFPATRRTRRSSASSLSAGLGVQGMSWVTSPACTELETLMLDWMQELLGLPSGSATTPRTAAVSSTARRRGHACRDPRRALASHRRRDQRATATPPSSWPTRPSQAHSGDREGPAHRRHRHRADALRAPRRRRSRCDPTSSTG